MGEMEHMSQVTPYHIDWALRIRRLEDFGEGGEGEDVELCLGIGV